MVFGNGNSCPEFRNSTNVAGIRILPHIFLPFRKFKINNSLSKVGLANEIRKVPGSSKYRIKSFILKQPGFYRSQALPSYLLWPFSHTYSSIKPAYNGTAQRRRYSRGDQPCHSRHCGSPFTPAYQYSKMHSLLLHQWKETSNALSSSAHNGPDNGCGPGYSPQHNVATGISDE